MWILLGSFIIQSIYYVFSGYYWLKLPGPETASAYPRVSIVICAKNEAYNLERNLPFILQQNYPGFEVLVVDVGSEDGTPKILQQLMEQYSQLKSLYIPPTEKIGAGKKYALQKGVQAAAHEIILLTDADCVPATKDWAQKMIGVLDGKDIALGISPYQKAPGLLNAFVEYETALTALQYITYSKAGSPYMGVGRNLCFRKNSFLQKKWSDAEMQMPSGDDDLFVQSIANHKNTATCMDKNSFTYSAAPANWKAWYRQKKRHLATGFQYSNKHQVLLGTFLFSKMLLYFSFLCLFTDGSCLLFSSAILLSYWIGLICVNYYLQHSYQLVPRWYLAPVLDMAYVFSIIFTGIAGKAAPQTTWK